MSPGPAEKALEAGRAMVAEQKEREAMQIQSGEGRKFTLAEQAVTDLTSNPVKNVAIVQAAIDRAVAEGAGYAELQQALREAGEKIEALEGQLKAAREVTVDAVAAEQKAKKDLADLQERFTEQNLKLGAMAPPAPFIPTGGTALAPGGPEPEITHKEGAAAPAAESPATEEESPF